MTDENKVEEKKVEESTSKKEGSKKSRLVWTIVGIVVSVIVLAIVGLGVGVYYTKPTNAFFNNVAKVLPYPAAKIGGSLVSVADYNENVRALTQYFKSQRETDLNDAANSDVRVQIQQSVLGRMVEDIALEKVAKDLGVEVTEADINTEFDSVTADLGDISEAEKTLQDLYGWTVDDFKKNVLEAQLRKQKIQKKYMEEASYTADEKTKAEEVLQKIKEGGDFAELAKQYSEDPQSAAEGGDLGKNEKGVFVQEFEDAALKLEPGQVSDVIQTEFGYHIIKLESKSDADFQARHILIATNFDEFVRDKVKESKISIYIRGFEWDAENVTIKILDTDGDGVVDEKDVDDDNDGATDEAEDSAGSDKANKSSTPDSVAPTTTDTTTNTTEETTTAE